MRRTGDSEVDLMLISMGVPPWLDYVSYFNKFQAFLLYAFCLYVSFASSFVTAVIYVVIFIVGKSAIMSVGLTHAQTSSTASPFIRAVLATTIFILVFNITVVTHYLQLW